MTRVLALTVILAGTIAATSRSGAADTALHGVADPARARISYMLKCQGCHQPQGQGNAANTPPLAGQIARFLAVPGGREFLGRVPGVATTDLDDARLAEVLNWTLYRFDREHLPRDFKPYTAAEIGALRKAPLRLERVETRQRLMAAIESKYRN